MSGEAYVSCASEEEREVVRSSLNLRSMEAGGRVRYLNVYLASPEAEAAFEAERQRRARIRQARAGTVDIGGRDFKPTFVVVKNFVRGTSPELIRTRFNATTFHDTVPNISAHARGEGILGFASEAEARNAAFRDGERFMGRRLFIQMLHPLEVRKTLSLIYRHVVTSSLSPALLCRWTD